MPGNFWTPWTKRLPNSDPQFGDVYYFPYIWKRQHDGEEAEKDRPCCVAVRLNKPLKNGTDVILLALSTTGYPDDGHGVRVPREELDRLTGLDPNEETWITTSEVNQTDHDHPYFDPSEYRGSFSKEWLKKEIYPLIRDIVLMIAERAKHGG